GALGGLAIRERLARLLARLRGDGRLPPDLALTPFRGHAYRVRRGLPRRLAGERFVLVGDAAGLARDVSGEGIGPAVRSGLLAAETILDGRPASYAGRVARTFGRPDAGPVRAQAAKLDLVRAKLRLAPGEVLLDIGCGWGSLVIWAAERYGVEAHGVTLSAAQAEWAGSAIRRAGLEGRARVEHLDYRDLPAGLRFEKIAAVGVIEH